MIFLSNFLNCTDLGCFKENTFICFFYFKLVNNKQKYLEYSDFQRHNCLKKVR